MRGFVEDNIFAAMSLLFGKVRVCSAISRSLRIARFVAKLILLTNKLAVSVRVKVDLVLCSIAMCGKFLIAISQSDRNTSGEIRTIKSSHRITQSIKVFYVHSEIIITVVRKECYVFPSPFKKTAGC